MRASAALFVAAAAGLQPDGSGLTVVEGPDFGRVLSKVRSSAAFKSKAAKMLPSFCDGAEDEDKCQEAVEHGLLCKAFYSKAQAYAGQGMDGAGDFVQRCTPIMSTSFLDVSGWVENPGGLFTGLTERAKAKTALDPDGADAFYGSAGDAEA